MRQLLGVRGVPAVARERRSDFAALREKVARVVERWGDTFGNRCPVPVHELAASYDVRRIRFEPLLSTAGLSKGTDGYVVHVNTEAYGAAQPAGTVLPFDQESFDRLKPQVRFSIAHEIGHVIFIKEANAGVANDKHRRNVKALEAACNQMAGVILIPKAQFLQVVGDGLFNVTRVVKAMDVFGVSAMTFVLRLKGSDLQRSAQNVNGVLALAQETGGTIVIGPIHVKGPLASGIWQNLSQANQEEPLEGLHLSARQRELVCQSKTVVEKICIGVRADRSVECVLTAERLRLKPLRLLVGIQVTGYPEKKDHDD